MIACSTKKDRFLNRNFQALNTKYNVLYHSSVALEKGVAELKLKYKDNFWEILPVERQLVVDKPAATTPNKEGDGGPPKTGNDGESIGGKVKSAIQKTIGDNLPKDLNASSNGGKESSAPLSANANFDRAETKATKAIQKRSMNFGGTERNSQIDEAYLMLGKARYYDQRFIPALDAFNYILYKYPSSDKIYEAKIWREKTNIRLDNDEVAVVNISKLLKEIKFKDQIFADANAIMAQAYIKTEQKDSAISKLRIATKFTKEKEEKARYRFIVGQLFEELGNKDSAFASYQEVIDMRRKSPRQYVIYANIKQALLKEQDSLLFLKNFKKLLADRENRPFLGAINHQIGKYYDVNKNNKQAKIFYNKSLKSKDNDSYLIASNYRNLADIYFYSAKYSVAGKYYDSTLTKLMPKSNEFRLIRKKRDNLDDVIKYEAIAHDNDSILKIFALTKSEKIKYFEDYIKKLKKEEAAKKLAESKAKSGSEFSSNSVMNDDPIDGNFGQDAAKKAASPPTVFGPKLSANGQSSSFYFYNSNTVAFGKIEFRKIWGDRTLKENWRNSSESKSTNEEDEAANKEEDNKQTDIKIDPKYTTAFYISKLPTKQDEIETLIKDRNFAYYQLGYIYKEKFKEYKLAQAKLEALLFENPEERLVLPAMYNLFRVYEITDQAKAIEIKSKILKLYPDSRYAQIISSDSGARLANETPNEEYKSLYKAYLKGEDFRALLVETEQKIDKYTGETIAPKFELLKANIIGKIKGLVEFKKALNFVALNYPNDEEGKIAEKFVGKDVALMEKLQFNKELPTSWKIIYKMNNSNLQDTDNLFAIISKFTKERTTSKLTSSIDLYTMDENFILIHGIKTEANAKDIATILKEFKDYNVKETPIVVSNYNYKIIQIKKNLTEYLENPNKKAEDKPDAPKDNQPEINKNNQKQGGFGQNINSGKEPISSPTNTDDPAPEQLNTTDKKK